MCGPTRAARPACNTTRKASEGREVLLHRVDVRPRAPVAHRGLAGREHLGVDETVADARSHPMRRPRTAMSSGSSGGSDASRIARVDTDDRVGHAAGPSPSSSSADVRRRREEISLMDVRHAPERAGVRRCRRRWILIEPPPSAPRASGPRPLATAAAAPPEEPPGVRARFHGFRVTPNSGLSVNGLWPNSGVVVLPTSTAPASRRRTGTASSVGTGRRRS
jgi:hypothetical protein